MNTNFLSLRHSSIYFLQWCSRNLTFCLLSYLSASSPIFPSLFCLFLPFVCLFLPLDSLSYLSVSWFSFSLSLITQGPLRAHPAFFSIPPVFYFFTRTALPLSPFFFVAFLCSGCFFFFHIDLSFICAFLFVYHLIFIWKLDNITTPHWIKDKSLWSS